MRNSFFRSIRSQLLILVFISVLPALGIVLYSGLTIQHKDIERAESDVQRVAHKLADSHEQTVEITRQFLVTLSRLPDVQNQDAGACNRIFGELLKENPLYANIFSATAEGMVFSNARPFTPHSIRDRKYYQDVMRTKDFSVGEYVVGVTVKKPTLHFAYPVRGTRGEFKGLVIAAFDLDSYGHLFSLEGLPPGSRLTLSDHKNRVLYRHPDPDKYMGSVDNPDLVNPMSSQLDEGIFTGLGNDGIKCVYGYKRFYQKEGTSPYLFLRVGITEKQALSHARNALIVNLALLGGSLLVAILSAWFLGRQLIVERLSRLIHAAQRLSHGDLQARTGLNHSQDELGLLTKAFDDMAVELEGKEAQWKSLQKALLESIARFKALFNATSDSVILIKPDGTILDLNKTAADRRDMDTETMLGKNIFDCLPTEAATLRRRAVTQVLLERNLFQYDELRDGKQYIIRLFPVIDERGGIFQLASFSRDISERKLAEEALKKSEEQYRQAQKMEAIGQLAGGVAHDFNNMLNIILGYSQLALMKIEPPSPLHTDIQEIMNAARRSADLVRQLLAFARKQTIAPKTLDLNDTVADMLNMLRKLIGEDIDLLWKPAINLWPVKMDPTQINQLLANLAVNARDSISGVGKITIETGDAEFDEAYCAMHAGFIPGKYALLAISDNGCGMNKETQEKIFEPFFTTKELGKGTGMGLATVYGIVKQNSGFINVYSEPGTGTTFRIYLPRHGEERPAIDEPLKQIKPLTGTETVLLVEDNEALLKMSKIMLEELGYAVLAAGSPDEAIQLVGQYAGNIHLLVTDVVMPEMNGRDLQKVLNALKPDMKYLFMSGYTTEVIAHHGILDEGVKFLQKPFFMNDLAAKVREAMGK